jgi:hypothetical protein
MLNSVLLAIAAATAAPQPANIEIGGSRLMKAVENCQSIKDNAARLACYDQAATALVSASSRGDVAIVDRGQVRQMRRSLFGFSLPRLPFFSGSKDRDVAQEPKELLSTLASFHSLGNGFFQFTLADPQSTWESTESSDVFDPKLGTKVTISHGALGSYWADIGGQPSVKVRRVH